MPMVKLVKEITTHLVDNPDKLVIEERSGEKTIIINIYADKSDIGKIIGKGGKIITGLRAIISNIASKNGKRLEINVIE